MPFPKLIVTLIISQCLIRTVFAAPNRYSNTIVQIRRLNGNELRYNRPNNQAQLRASANSFLLDLLTRVVTFGSIGRIRPTEPLSTNRNSIKWDRLGWGW
uniref:Secreted protein n=1 Tax=Panagrellus redivivus TaxID=6233 RepID=A0A7E4V3D9_PANRE